MDKSKIWPSSKSISSKTYPLVRRLTKEVILKIGHCEKSHFDKCVTSRKIKFCQNYWIIKTLSRVNFHSNFFAGLIWLFPKRMYHVVSAAGQENSWVVKNHRDETPPKFFAIVQIPNFGSRKTWLLPFSLR